MSVVVGLLVFFLTLGIVIFVHEMGHFLAAKAVGVTVEEFSFGFGPKLLTLMKRGGTDFTVRALPLGGFVSMIGMQPEEVEVPNGLMSKPAWAKALVFVAGPLMNVILALLIFCCMGMITGIPAEHSRQVYQVMPKAADGSQSEADRIGLRTGDVIVAVNGVPMKNGDQLIAAIQSHPGQPIRLTVRRDGQTLIMKATPKPEPVETGSKQIVGRLGFQPGFRFKRLAFVPSLKAGLNDFVNFFLFLKDMFQHPALLKESAGGPIAMLRATNMDAKLGVGYQYNFVGTLSLELAIANLLPLPVLDGGHLALLLVECFSGLFWRRRLDPEVHRVATAIGLAVICALVLFLTYSDVARWVHHQPLQ